MKGKPIKQFLLYNYRYRLAYTCLFAASGFFLAWRLWSLPAGAAEVELATLANNQSLSNLLQNPINLLHGLLQWASVRLLDESILALRLPGALLGAFTVFVFYHLSKKWFGKPAALICSVLLVSADWYLSGVRLGVGGVELSFWLAVSLYSLTQLVTHNSKWLLGLALALTGLLFTPFGPYAAIALLAGTLGTTAFRSRISKEVPDWIRIMSALLVLGAVSAVIGLGMQNTDFIKTLLGVADGLPGVATYLQNVALGAGSVVALLPANNPVNGPTGLLLVRYFELVFMLFGFIMLWRTRVNRLNVIVLILAITLTLVSGLSDGPFAHGLLVIPAAIYLTAGLRHFIRRWQKTFPKNPYARIAAFAPLSVLLALTVASHYYLYFILWPNQAQVRAIFNQEVSLDRQP